MSAVRRALSPPEWRQLGRLGLVIAALHVAGAAMLLAIADGTTGAITVGVGLTAYSLGLRHAFDADHIAAIDNTTRKLMTDGRRPLSVGFFFALGHSTVVLVLALLLAAGVRALGGAVQDEGSMLQTTTGLVGTLVSGSFLYAIGILNLLLLIGVARVFGRARRGELTEAELEAELVPRGPLHRLYGRLTGLVRKPWHMYPLGILFGLGLETASEVTLLTLSASTAQAGQIGLLATLSLPLLFAAGMSAFDTCDGLLMSLAYTWSQRRPARRLYYNIVTTWATVFVAGFISSVYLAAVLVEHAGVAFLAGYASLADHFELLGYVIVAFFVAVWGGAVALWRFGGFDRRYAGQVLTGGDPDDLEDKGAGRTSP